MERIFTFCNAALEKAPGNWTGHSPVTFVHVMVAAVLLIVVPASQAQMLGARSIMVEPLIGYYYYYAEFDFSDRYAAGGVRVLWRRSYDRELYAEFLMVEQSGQGFAYTNLFGTIGLSSIILDRDATGFFGVRLMMGLGGMVTETQWNSILTASVLTEVEITRRVGLRLSSSMYMEVEFEHGVDFRLLGTSLLAGLAITL